MRLVNLVLMVVMGAAANAAPVNSDQSISIVDGDAQMAPVGDSLERPLRVRIRDGRSLAVARAIVDWTIVSGDGGFEQASSYSDASGIAVGNLRLGRKPGVINVRATLRGTTYFAPFTAVAAVGDVATIEIKSGNAQSCIAGSELAQPLRVQLKDQFGNPVPDATVEWSVINGGGKPSASLSSTDQSGTTSITWVPGTFSGSQRVRAQVLKSSPTMNVVFSATVLAGVAARVELLADSSAQTVAGSSRQVMARVTDKHGNPVAAVPVEWAVDAKGIGPTDLLWWKQWLWRWRPQTSTTDGQGIARLDAETGLRAGKGEIHVRIQGTDIATQMTAATVAGRVGVMEKLSGDGQSRKGGTALDAPLKVVVRDAHGNPVSQATVQWQATAGGGVLNAPTSLTDKNGVAQISVILGRKPGANRIRASIGRDVSAEFQAESK